MSLSDLQTVVFGVGKNGRSIVENETFCPDPTPQYRKQKGRTQWPCLSELAFCCLFLPWVSSFLAVSDCFSRFPDVCHCLEYFFFSALLILKKSHSKPALHKNSTIRESSAWSFRGVALAKFSRKNFGSILRISTASARASSSLPAAG